MEESERQQHENHAKAANSAVWQWLDGGDAFDRDAEEEAREAAYASAWHWRKTGSGLHRQRSEWLLSLVCERIGDLENARRHARTCAAMTTDFAQEMRDFDIAYSWEAQMRAAFYQGDTNGMHFCRDKATEAGAHIAHAEDRAIFESDFEKSLARIAAGKKS